MIFCSYNKLHEQLKWLLVRHMLKCHNQATFVRNQFSQTSRQHLDVVFMWVLFFELCFFGNLFMPKCSICILKPMLGDDFRYSDVFMHKNYSPPRTLRAYFINKFHKYMYITSISFILLVYECRRLIGFWSRWNFLSFGPPQRAETADLFSRRN